MLYTAAKPGTRSYPKTPVHFRGCSEISDDIPKSLRGTLSLALYTAPKPKIMSEDSRRIPRTFKKFTLFIVKSFDSNQTHVIFLKRSYHIGRHPKPSEDVPEICDEILKSSDAAIFLALCTIPTF